MQEAALRPCASVQLLLVLQENKDAAPLTLALRIQKVSNQLNCRCVSIWLFFCCCCCCLTKGAYYSRDALAKALYARCFDWIIARVNDALGWKSDPSCLIMGILDIYGFEIFGVIQKKEKSFFCFFFFYSSSIFSRRFSLDRKTDSNNFASTTSMRGCNKFSFNLPSKPSKRNTQKRESNGSISISLTTKSVAI